MRNDRVFKRGFVKSLISGVIPLIFTGILVAIVFIGLGQTEEASRAEGIRLLEEAIVRVAIHSFAVNGYFPADIDYIVDYYGVFIDTTRFVVHYDAFAPNILPNIRVFER